MKYIRTTCVPAAPETLCIKKNLHPFESNTVSCETDENMVGQEHIGPIRSCPTAQPIEQLTRRDQP